MATYKTTESLFWKRLILICLVLGFCAGCSTKTPDMMPALTSGGGSLTDSERAILFQNKGRIARSVPDYASPLVEQQAAFFLHTSRKTIEVTSKRAEKYLVYTKSVFRAHGMPEELAYLAVVESGYNPKARSSAGAAGAWQFMPFTGKKFGLQQDNWEDERLDIYSATVAAAQYLKKLYNDFGDWPTAIAAYNAGEGKMSRACKAAGERTFFGVLTKNNTLDEKTRLREETRQYVPRFLAIVAIMENLEALGFQGISPENAPQVCRVHLAPSTSLKSMASACAMSWTEFKGYNPHFLTEVSHKTRRTRAYVPERATAQAVAFARNPVRASGTALASADKSAPRYQAANSMAGGRYTLRKGDTLTSVARTHKTTVASLMAANGLRNAHEIRVGQVLSIPGAKNSGTTTQVASSRVSNSRNYCVQPKDNLWKVSRKLNVSVDDLKRWNRLSSESLHVGQTLVVLR